MSGRNLTDPQILLLSKGLSFIPTPRDSTNFELLADFNRFSEKIRSLSKSRQTNNNNNKKFPLRRAQKWKPRQQFFSSTDLEGVLEKMKLEISCIPTTDKIPHNLSPEERRALRELKYNNDLVINKADKGSTIVVQNKTDYITDALEHLSDSVTYKELNGDPTFSICRGIRQLLNSFLSEGLLNKKNGRLLLPSKKSKIG